MQAVRVTSSRWKTLAEAEFLAVEPERTKRTKRTLETLQRTRKAQTVKTCGMQAVRALTAGQKSAGQRSHFLSGTKVNLSEAAAGICWQAQLVLAGDVGSWSYGFKIRTGHTVG